MLIRSFSGKNSYDELESYRVSINITFIKSTIFKSKITLGTSNGMRENIESWFKVAGESGFMEKKLV